MWWVAAAWAEPMDEYLAARLEVVPTPVGFAVVEGGARPLTAIELATRLGDEGRLRALRGGRDRRVGVGVGLLGVGAAGAVVGMLQRDDGPLRYGGLALGAVGLSAGAAALGGLVPRREPARHWSPDEVDAAVRARNAALRDELLGPAP